MTRAHPELNWLQWISEFLQGWHKFTCRLCRYPIHPWEEKCPSCGAWHKWDKRFTAEQLAYIRTQHTKHAQQN